MADATTTTYDAVLKELYPQSSINNLVYAGAPLLAMLRKSEDFFGDNMVLATQYGNPQGVSASFANAQGNASPSSMTKFNLTRSSHYAVATLTSELIEASANNKGAIVEALKNEMDGALAQLGRRWHASLYGNGGGAIGQAPASGGPLTGTTLTLQNLEDVANFEIGQELVFSTADGTSGAVKSGSVTVTEVNRDTGVLTTDALSAIDGGTGVADDDYIFIEGDFGLVTTGLGGWFPTTAPTGGDSFFTVDRSVDVTRLAGVRYDGSGDSSKQAALINGLTKLARQGAAARPDFVFMNTVDFGDLIVELGSKVEYQQHSIKGGTAPIGFEYVTLHSPAGSVKIVPDFQCPEGRCYALKMDTLKWCGLGKSPRILTTDGLKMLRQSAADGVEFRCVLRGQLGCTAPGWNAVIQLP